MHVEAPEFEPGPSGRVGLGSGQVSRRHIEGALDAAISEVREIVSCEG